MIDDVARAICDEAGRQQRLFNGESCGHGPCHMCVDGKCGMVEQFRQEARAAILAAYRWHKRERRWPAFCK